MLFEVLKKTSGRRQKEKGRRKKGRDVEVLLEAKRGDLNENRGSNAANSSTETC
jgi:hypothetical protein